MILYYFRKWKTDVEGRYIKCIPTSKYSKVFDIFKYSFLLHVQNKLLTHKITRNFLIRTGVANQFERTGIIPT